MPTRRNSTAWFTPRAVVRGINKRVTCHALRHGLTELAEVSFATHLLEAGYHVRQVQALPGHGSLKTAMNYVHVMNKPAVAVTNPLDRLAAVTPP
jgi:site-specific recombinase XerD